MRTGWFFLYFSKVENCNNRSKKVKMIYLPRLKQEGYAYKPMHFSGNPGKVFLS